MIEKLEYYIANNFIINSMRTILVDFTGLTMKLIFVYFFTVLLIISCVSSPTKTKEELENLQFMDADTFDQELSESMLANNETITVLMIGKVSVNKMPERLGKWLSVITAKNGNVDFQPITPPVNGRTTGSIAITTVIGLLPTAYDFFKNEFSYGPAVNYNAILYYQPDTGLLIKATFIKKP